MAGPMVKTDTGTIVIFAYNSDFLSVLLSFLALDLFSWRELYHCVGLALVRLEIGKGSQRDMPELNRVDFVSVCISF